MSLYDEHANNGHGGGYAVPNILADLPSRMTELCTQEQLRAVNKIVHSRGGLVWWRVGEGKTRIALFTFAALQNIHQWALPSICLVVCRRKAFRDWRDEIERCFPECDVYEDSCPAHPPRLAPCFLLVSEGMLVKQQKLLASNWQIRFICYDESWLYANPKSTRSKAAYDLSRPRKAIALSGTVMKARDTSEIWAQCKIVHKHRLIASSLSAFRENFQVCFSDLGFPLWSSKKGAYADIMHRLSEVTDVHFPKSSRQIHEQFHTIEATEQQRRYFRELKEFYSIDDLDMEFNNAMVVITKAQQISCGWIFNEAGNLVSIPSNKPAKLRDELEDIIASGQRAVVWCAFRHDVEMLAKFLPFATMQMLGGEDFDVDRWLAGDVSVCLATEASGSSVNHFAQVPYAIYFSSDFKWLSMQQSRGRTDRKSSTHLDCYYKYLQVDGSMDAHVFRTAMGSGDKESKLILQAELRTWFNKR